MEPNIAHAARRWVEDDGRGYQVMPRGTRAVLVTPAGRRQLPAAFNVRF
jgi:hypothetical protein